jgi:hypothetical protein
MNHGIRIIACASLLAIASTTTLGQSSIARLDFYTQQGVVANPVAGEALWYSVSSNQRGCTSCHAQSPTQAGTHAKTGKPINPMAPSVNPERYRDDRKVEKWFLRNCKWTLGRECTMQEKADLLAWLEKQ